MNFKRLLQRANLNSLETFLRNGGENYLEPNMNTYSQRLEIARKKLSAFFGSICDEGDVGEYDRIAGEVYEQIAIHEDVYFEIGLILGAKIAFQIRGKMEELM